MGQYNGKCELIGMNMKGVLIEQKKRMLEYIFGDKDPKEGGTVRRQRLIIVLCI